MTGSPDKKLDLLMRLARAGIIDAKKAWELLWLPVGGEPCPPMPESFERAFIQQAKEE